MKMELPYVQHFKDRHGKDRYYFRKNGKRQALEGEPGTPEFMQSYNRIKGSFEAVRPDMGGINALVTSYLVSPECALLRASTKTEYRRLLDKFRTKFGDLDTSAITRRVIIEYRNSMQATPATANGSLRMLRILYGWGLKNEWVTFDPTVGVDFLKHDAKGWQAWSDDDLDTFTVKSEGTPRMAFYLALYTGQRRGDILKMRWDAIKGNAITVKQSKTGKEMVMLIPVHVAQPFRNDLAH